MSVCMMYIHAWVSVCVCTCVCTQAHTCAHAGQKQTSRIFSDYSHLIFWDTFFHYTWTSLVGQGAPGVPSVSPPAQPCEHRSKLSHLIFYVASGNPNMVPVCIQQAADQLKCPWALSVCLYVMQFLTRLLESQYPAVCEDRIVLPSLDGLGLLAPETLLPLPPWAGMEAEHCCVWFSRERGSDFNFSRLRQVLYLQNHLSISLDSFPWIY